MFMELYAIKDDVAGSFMPPAAVPHLVEMTRALSAAVQDPNSKLSKYPGDFSLYRVGKFDQVSGKLVVDPSGPVFVSHVSSFIQPVKKQEAA